MNGKMGVLGRLVRWEDRDGRCGCWRLGDWDSTRTHPQAGAGLAVPAVLLAALDLCGEGDGI